jgi:hypothetical protein
LAAGDRDRLPSPVRCGAKSARFCRVIGDDNRCSLFFPGEPFGPRDCVCLGEREAKGDVEIAGYLTARLCDRLDNTDYRLPLVDQRFASDIYQAWFVGQRRHQPCGVEQEEDSIAENDVARPFGDRHDRTQTLTCNIEEHQG